MQLKGLVTLINMVHSGRLNVDILCGIRAVFLMINLAKVGAVHGRKWQKAIYQAGGDGESNNKMVEIEREMESREVDEICQPITGISNNEETANELDNLETPESCYCFKKTIADTKYNAAVCRMHQLLCQ